MAIDLDSETIITLGEACRAVPPHGISPATMARWIQRGVRGGARFETVLVGGRRLTSREAIARFIATQNPDQTPAATITPGQRRKQAETANRVLAEAGL